MPPMIVERLEYLVAWPIDIEILHWAKAYEDQYQGYSMANSYVLNH